MTQLLAPTGAVAAPSALDALDDETMGRVRGGDRNAFADLVRRHEQPVKRYLARMTGPAEASDLAQETFMAIWNTRERYQPRGRFKVFLYKIARTQALTHLRWRKVRTLFAAKPHDDVGPAGMAAPLPQDTAVGRLVKEEALQQLHAQLAALPQDTRDILVLRFVEDMDYITISEITGVSQTALRSRLHRAVGQLSGAMGAGGA